MTAVNVGEKRIGGAEAGVVVLLPAQGRGTLYGPGAAWPPGLDLDRAVHMYEVNGGRAFGCEGRAPSLTVVQAQRRALTDRPDRQGEVERLAELESCANWYVQRLTRLSEPRR